ncbi:transposase [Azospirillum sp. A1-3]|nr:transposase [Azospirillum sp. A1-3]MCM8738521.1 transposase [Azospirillum sp. A1-3]
MVRASSSTALVNTRRRYLVTAALSDGTGIAPANPGQKALRALRKAQRALARKTRGSANRRKAVRRIARIQMRVANARKDFLHKHSTIIAKTHGVVGVEGLPVRSLSASATGTVAEPGRRVRQKAGLNRASLDQGWGLFRTMLADKLADRGGRLVEVPAADTSQTCACCGHVDAANRPSQAVFVCGRCGHRANADTNAATNILRRADGALTPEEEHRTKRPDDAGPSRRAAGCGSPEPPPVRAKRMSGWTAPSLGRCCTRVANLLLGRCAQKAVCCAWPVQNK